MQPEKGFSRFSFAETRVARFQAALLADFHIIHRPAVRLQCFAGALGERGKIVVTRLRALGDGLQSTIQTRSFGALGGA